MSENLRWGFFVSHCIYCKVLAQTKKPNKPAVGDCSFVRLYFTVAAFHMVVCAGILFGLTMIMVSISLVMSVIVTNIYLRKDSPERVPRCLRRLFLRHDVAKPATRLVPPPPPPPPPPTSNGKLRQSANGRDGDMWTVGGQVRDDVELSMHRLRRRGAVHSIHLSDVDDNLDDLDRRLAPPSGDLALFADGPHRRAHRPDRDIPGSRCTAGKDDATVS